MLILFASIVISKTYKPNNHFYFSKFDAFKEGEFLLYRPKTTEFEVAIEVRTYLRACTQGLPAATCNCAVAIRSGDDVIIMDRCGAGKPDENGALSTEKDRRMTMAMYLNGELTEGTSIEKKKGGKKFYVSHWLPYSN